jgi:hypothetical protein
MPVNMGKAFGESKINCAFTCNVNSLRDILSVLVKELW